MGEYRRLNFSKVNFSDEVISYEEALKKTSPFTVPDAVILGQKEIKVTNAEKDYDNKCVKLEIFC